MHSCSNETERSMFLALIDFSAFIRVSFNRLTKLLRMYVSYPYCNLFSIEIENKIKHKFIYFSFPYLVPNSLEH